jgi:predicted secreted protein
MAVAGKNGKVIIGESGNQKVAAIKNWSLELSLETLETTALGDDWKNYITGLKEWTASSEGDYEVPTDTQGQAALQDAYLAGTTVTVKLYVDGTNYYQGTAYISSLSIEDPVDDVVSISLELTGTGELSFHKDLQIKVKRNEEGN